MKDIRRPAAGVVRAAEVDEEGTAVFQTEDFMGFMAAEMSKNGGTEKVFSDGSVAFPQSQLRVQLPLNADRYAPKKADIDVSADSSMEYIFSLDSGNSSTVASQQSWSGMFTLRGGKKFESIDALPGITELQ